MELFWLSILQGITEFIPVSSSAHAFIFAKFFHFQPMTRAMEVSLNTITLSVIVLYFRKDMWEMIRATFLVLKGRMTEPFHRGMKICVATIPVVIAGYFMHEYFDHYVQMATLIGIMSIVFGTLLMVVDRFCTANRKFRQISYWHAFVMGCFQMLALVPGVSRSGSTLIGARLLGYARRDAAHFSFLMAIPVGVGAFVLTAKDLIFFKCSEGPMAFVMLMLLLTFSIGYATLTFFMKWLAHQPLFIWALYRIIFGLFVLYYFY
ncbi:MAG: undecaprenyl-diphosphate phosphatase [Alphaproteobacteria bacterium]